MAKIKLNTPTCLSGDETTTEYESNDIIFIQSIVGDDSSDGTYFYIKGVGDQQSCTNSAAYVKKLVKKYKPTFVKTKIIPMILVVIPGVLIKIIAQNWTNISDYFSNIFN